MKSAWFEEHLTDSKSSLPFSFTYDGRPSTRLLAEWPATTVDERLDTNRTRRTLVWTDPKSGIEVRCVAVDYTDYPAVEWTVWFRNTGNADTPILQDIQGLDATFTRPAQGEFVLRHWKGDTGQTDDLYQPFELPLGPGATQRFAPLGGRGSNGAFPYYNLTLPGGGTMIAVGWPGQWAATFTRDAQRGLRITAGQELTHLSLKPGESIRSPLMALLFWQGADTAGAQNLWRRWMWAHNVPRTADSKLPPPILLGNTSPEFNEMICANEENQKDFIDRYLDAGIRLDYWWMDAGWYTCDETWHGTGNWEPDPVRFPNGLKAIADYGKPRNIKTLVWFEPERVGNKDCWVARNHPEWLLGGIVLNLGHPGALRWLTDCVDEQIRKQDIALYRQDFNIDPLEFWRQNDALHRRGVTENLYVQGYLAYWDALLKRHPQLVIDSCASGGRRNDLETMRRAVALHPTDYNYSHLEAKQAFHASLYQWIPWIESNTLPIDTVDAYAFRSGHGLSVVLCYDLRNKNLDCGLLRRLTEQWRQIVPCYYGDFYPLMPYSLDEAAWTAWQFYRIEQGDGVVEAFRRGKSEDAARTFRLFGLDSAAMYEVTNFDVEGSTKASGKDLMEKGMTVEIKDRPGAAVIAYRRVHASMSR